MKIRIGKVSKIKNATSYSNFQYVLSQKVSEVIRISMYRDIWDRVGTTRSRLTTREKLYLYWIDQ